MQNLNPIISIIIPVYNVEDYIYRCVESVANQIIKNIEVIIVNDGSKDSSVDIIMKSGLIDDRFKIIEKENGGLSDARNVGLKSATGDYILFLDSDDYIAYNATEVLVSKVMENPKLDIIYFNFIKVFDNYKNSKSKRCKDNKVFTGREYLSEQLKFNEYTMQACVGLYKKDFLLNNNLFFTKGILHEDVEWTPRVLNFAKEVVYIEQKLYYYQLRKESITQKSDKTVNSQHLIRICNDLEDLFVDDKKLNQLFNEHLIEVYLGAVIQSYYHGILGDLIIEKSFFKRKKLSFINYIRVIVFRVNIKLYCFLFKQVQRIRGKKV